MNDDMKVRMIRLAADMFIPVGQRESLIASMYEMIEDAKSAKTAAIQAQSDIVMIKADLETIKRGIDMLLANVGIIAPIITETSENAEVAATESAIAADNTDQLVNDETQVTGE